MDLATAKGQKGLTDMLTACWGTHQMRMFFAIKNEREDAIKWLCMQYDRKQQMVQDSVACPHSCSPHSPHSPRNPGNPMSSVTKSPTSAGRNGRHSMSAAFDAGLAKADFEEFAEGRHILTDCNAEDVTPFQFAFHLGKQGIPDLLAELRVKALTTEWFHGHVMAGTLPSAEEVRPDLPLLTHAHEP